MARIPNSAPVGSLVKPPAPRRDAKYLAAIRLLPCLICRVTPCREAAHVRMSSHAGMGRKPCDRRTLPLCHIHHMEQHTEGEKPYWDRIGIDPFQVIEALNDVYPDQTVMAAIIVAAAP